MRTTPVVDAIHNTRNKQFHRFAVDVDRARAVIVAQPDFSASRRIVDALRRFHPRARILVAVQSLGQQEQLRQLGAEEVVALSLEGTLRFSRMVLRALGVAEASADSILAAMEADDYAAMRSAEPQAASVTPSPGS